MQSNTEFNRIISLIKREVVPAIGCTEPIAVAFAVARATEILGETPLKISVTLSGNVLKNAMGVGIPNTGMTGLPIAIALGSTVGRSSYGLEVLRDVTPESVERAKAIIESGVINIEHDERACDKLYIRVNLTAQESTSEVVIAGGHTNIISESHNGEVLSKCEHSGAQELDDSEFELTMRKVYDFAMEVPLEDVRFILESKRLNLEAAQVALKGKYGHNIGRLMLSYNNIYGSNSFVNILSYTSAACDARMAGAMIPVMSNSGSGNQGIAATLPVVIMAQERGSSEEELIRALILSHLTVIYIKLKLGRLSAMCGCVVAATGSSCGMTHLMGGDYTQATQAVKNMVANLTGVICDGAKPSCALKISSGVSTAVIAATMAMDNICVESVEGIIDNDVDRCIENLTSISCDGMGETDRLVLNIMTSK